MIDIPIHFLSSYRDQKTGREIFQPLAIAKNYLNGEFPIDFLTAFPFAMIGKAILGNK